MNSSSLKVFKINVVFFVIMVVRDCCSAASGMDDWHGTIDTSAGL